MSNLEQMSEQAWRDFEILANDNDPFYKEEFDNAAKEFKKGQFVNLYSLDGSMELGVFGPTDFCMLWAKKFRFEKTDDVKDSLINALENGDLNDVRVNTYKLVSRMDEYSRDVTILAGLFRLASRLIQAENHQLVSKLIPEVGFVDKSEVDALNERISMLRRGLETIRDFDFSAWDLGERADRALRDDDALSERD